MDVKDSAPDSDIQVKAFRFKLMSLKKRKDFLEIRNGVRSHNRAFVLQMVQRSRCISKSKGLAIIREDPHVFRIGYTITKKIGNSVDRNRIRRRLREAMVCFFSHKGNCSEFSGFDCVLIAKREAMTMSFLVLNKEIDRALHFCVKKAVSHSSFPKRGKPDSANKVIKR
ncbi:ribonuclease P protein component [Candidatus Endowatersipora endosymbiont of Watersipora subatra]|uniref:ribonuclease P protein component n=1 Tax=Candidatus Endowatersipora endosymbiont of Watersipora subatra TaxID=3077946 RepID=UPI00312C81C0